MTEKEILPIILTLADNVWKNWGIFSSITIGLLGWLTQRGGLHSHSQKKLITVAYTVFSLVVSYAMHYTYEKLDQATNELADSYMLKTANSSVVKKSKTEIPVENGLVYGFLHRSPNYCAMLEQYTYNEKCRQYSYDGYFALLLIFVFWFLVVRLFWKDSIWKTTVFKGSEDKKVNLEK